MPLGIGDSDARHVHHHGILAGAGAGAVAVVAVALIAWRAATRMVGVAAPVIGWALVVLVVGVVIEQLGVRFLRLKHYAAHPEALVPQRVSAEVIQAQPVPVLSGVPVRAVPAATPLALPTGPRTYKIADPQQIARLVEAGHLVEVQDR